MEDTVGEKNPEIVEGEVVEEPTKESSDSQQAKNDNDQATIILSLEQLIKNHISSIDKLKVELKKHKEMLEDAFLNDPVYQEHLKLAKEAVKVKSATRAQISKQPANVQLSNKIKNMTAEVKDKNYALSDYLLEYQRLTGVNEIEGEDGDIREIVNSAKVVRKASSK